MDKPSCNLMRVCLSWQSYSLYINYKARGLYESLSTTMSTAQTKAFAVSLYPHRRLESELKRSLWRSTHLTDEDCRNGCCLDKHRLLLASLLLLALCGMVLLLLWNYQCFIVSHICQDPEHSSEYVLFDMDEQRLSS